jgi:creatinine amidohydrolase
MKRQGYWADLSAADFAALDAARTIAVLPVGAIEQHGPHLPVSVDRDLVEEVVKRSLPLLDDDLSVLFLPTQQIGKSNEHIAFAGTLTLSAETLMRVWMEIGASVARAGIRKLVLFNGHGGNVAAMDMVARDLRARHGMLTASCSWFQFSSSQDVLDAYEMVHGIHGGDGETSAMLAVRPDLVDMGQARNFRSRGEDWAETHEHVGVGGKAVKLGWLIDDLNQEGACGNAAAANPDKGEKLLLASAKGFAEFLVEFDKMSAAGLSAHDG